MILAVLWISLAATMYWTARAPWMRALLVMVGVGVTLHVARLPSVQTIAARRAEG